MLINQSSAMAGNVTPGDAPGFPVSLTVPGSYRLSGNLTVPDANTTAIVISSNDVTLDLNGFGILGPVVCALYSCPGAGGVGTGGAGIRTLISTQYTNITIRNGTIRGLGGNAVLLYGDTFLVEYMRIESNNGVGILLSSVMAPIQENAIVRHNIVNLNSDTGISVIAGSVIENRITKNGQHGIFTVGPSLLINNASRDNAFYDFSLADGSGYTGNALNGNGSGHVIGGTNLGQNLCGNVACPGGQF